MSHLEKMDSPEFVFTSLHPAENKDSPVPYAPRARTCIFRGMWAELPENKHNDAPQNERVYESDLLTLTTDVRMAKVPEIFASSSGHGNVGQSQGSGGGGPVEAVFWAKEVMTQWRFRGEACRCSSLLYLLVTYITTNHPSQTSLDKTLKVQAKSQVELER
jgi:pyridoxamine 5'-phosphate oxidase